jgi:hypothetical protein
MLRLAPQPLRDLASCHARQLHFEEDQGRAHGMHLPDAGLEVVRHPAPAPQHVQQQRQRCRRVDVVVDDDRPQLCVHDWFSCNPARSLL